MDEFDDAIRGWRIRLEQVEGQLSQVKNFTSPYARRLIETRLKLKNEIANVEEIRKARKEAEFARLRVGKNIDKLRKECGWSLDKLEDETGIDKKLILSHVHGKSNPTRTALIRRCNTQARTVETRRPRRSATSATRNSLSPAAPLFSGVWTRH